MSDHGSTGHTHDITGAKDSPVVSSSQQIWSIRWKIVWIFCVLMIAFWVRSCASDHKAKEQASAVAAAQSQPAVVPEVHKGQVMSMKAFTFSQCIIQNLHRGWYSYVFLGDIEVRDADGKVLAVLSASKEVNLGWMPSDANYFFCPSPSDGSTRKIHIYNNWEASARSQSHP